jgi:hypothetical protein
VKELLTSADPVDLFGKWVSSEWPAIAEKLIENAERYEIGVSPVKAMRAALMLHDSGYYELVPRVLFPEIEKCVAEQFYGGTVDRDETQLSEFREIVEAFWAFATAGFSLFGPSLGVGQNQMQILALHSYAGSSKKNPRPVLPNADCFPNRNRVLHGLQSGD